MTVLPALSFLDLAWAALGIDPLAVGVRLVDAAAFGDVAARERGPFLLAQCWSRHLLSEVKLSAPDEAGPELPRPVILHHLGLPDEVVVGGRLVGARPDGGAGPPHLALRPGVAGARRRVLR